MFSFARDDFEFHSLRRPEVGGQTGGGRCSDKPAPRSPDTGARLWTENRCANLVMARLILKPHHVYHISGARLSKNGRWIEINSTHRLPVGAAIPVTIHLARAVEYRRPRAVPWDGMRYRGTLQNPDPGDLVEYGEACRLHLGRMVLGFDRRGRESLMACSEPVEGSETFRTTHVGSRFIARAGTNKRPRTVDDAVKLQRGREYFLSAYETPYAAEGALYSQHCRCGTVR